MQGLGIGLGLGVSALNGGGIAPPAGFVFLIDADGYYLIDSDGYYLVERA